MGGLPPVRAPRRWTLLVTLVATGCDTGGDGAPAKSRVQSVLVEPGSKTTPTAELAQTKAPTTPVAAKPRPALCQGQLEAKPQPFNPKRVPSRISLDPDHGLAPDPLKKMKAGRWTWVNFWAAWCVPCKTELPLLFRWRDALENKVEFSFVSLDDDERQLREFLAREPASGLTRTYWLPDGATRQAWLEALNLKTEPELPLQLLIDPNGMLRCRVEGAVEPEDLAALERILRG